MSWAERGKLIFQISLKMTAATRREKCVSE